MMNRFLAITFLIFSCFEPVHTQVQLPQQNNLVLGGRNMIIVRGVDPSTDTWTDTDSELDQLIVELNDYLQNTSFNKAWLDSFDITPVYDFTVDPVNNGAGSLSQTLSVLATNDGYDLSSYNIVMYIHESTIDFGGAGALGSGNGLNGTLWVNNDLAGYFPGNIHESFHAMGTGHAETIEGNLSVFPGVVTGGHDPYHFMGSEGDAGLDSDIPNYMKYFLGWIDSSNVVFIPESPAVCDTVRIYKSSIVQNYDVTHNYSIQLGDNLWISYEPDNSNSRIETVGVLFHYIQGPGSAVSRLLDMNPNSITQLPSTLGSNWLPVIDFWDAALTSSDEYVWENTTMNIVNEGGTGEEKWVEIQFCNCSVLSGDDDGDGVCNDIDMCSGGDDTIDSDFDLIPDSCDSCPMDPDNDSNNNNICDNIECLNLTTDQFDYEEGLPIDGNNGGVGFSNAWTSSTLNGSITITQGSLDYEAFQTLGNKLTFTLDDEDETKGCSRNLNVEFKTGNVLWVSFLLKYNDLADGGFWVKPNGNQAIAIGKRWGNQFSIDNNSTDISIQEGEVYRVVAKYELNPIETNVFLWINETTNFDVNNADASKTLGPIASIDWLSVDMEKWGDGIAEIDDLKFGCDGFGNILTETDTQITCNSYTWIDGQTYTSSNNTATDTLVNSMGFDSLITTLNLTINPLNVNVIENGLLLTCENTLGDSYQWVDCNNNYSEITGETGITFEAIENGSFAVIIESEECIDTSECIVVSTVGVQNQLMESLMLIYPNPTEGTLTIDLGEIYSKITVRVLSVDGQLVLEKEFENKDLVNLNLDIARGGYFLEIETDEGIRETVKVVKK